VHGAKRQAAGNRSKRKIGNREVIGYATREKFGKQKKFEDNAWFVGYAPRRNPEIVVAVLVQESGNMVASGRAVVKDTSKSITTRETKRRRVSTRGEARAMYLGRVRRRRFAPRPP